MNREEMLQTLQTLHSELSTTGSIDSETREMLQTLTDDILRVLTENAEEPGDDTQKPLSERLRETAIDFEVRHPIIGGLLERLTDGLANMGI